MKIWIARRGVVGIQIGYYLTNSKGTVFSKEHKGIFVFKEHILILLYFNFTRVKNF